MPLLRKLLGRTANSFYNSKFNRTQIIKLKLLNIRYYFNGERLLLHTLYSDVCMHLKLSI